MTAVDPRIEWLRLFNGVMETVQPALHALATELDGISHQLNSVEIDLRAGLQDIESQADAVARQASESATEAVHAAEELSAHLHQEIDAALPALEQQVTQAKEQLGHALQEEASALDAALTSLQHDAFEPLDTLLKQRQDDFTAWADQNDEGLAPYVGELLTAANEWGASGQKVGEELANATTAVDNDRSDFGATKWAILNVDSKIADEFKKALEEVQTALHTFHESHTQTWTGGPAAEEQQLTDYSTTAAKAIEEAAGHSLALIDTVSQGLERLQVEVERSAAGAESEQARVTAVAALKPQIAEADQNIVTINGVLHAMAPP